MPMSKKDLAEAKANLKAQARQNIIERGLFQFRCEPETYARLLDLAASRRMPVSTMVREWVEQRLASEEAQAQPGNSTGAMLIEIRNALRTAEERLRQVIEPPSEDVTVTTYIVPKAALPKLEERVAEITAEFNAQSETLAKRQSQQIPARRAKRLT